MASPRPATAATTRWWPIEPARKHYAWGSRSALPAMLGEPPGTEPLAELWFGTHADGPAMARDGVACRPLADALAATGHGNHMGFMVKLIAADAPLSIQVHPGDETATTDAAKHEMLVALGPFRLLCGFAPIDAAAARLDDAGLHALATVTRTQGIAATIRAIVTLDASACDDAILLATDRDPLAVELAACYPGDRGVLSALLLNELTIDDGDAIALPAGTVHAYLGGVGIEAMTESDAVHRLGLTAKAIDPDQFLEVADTTTGVPPLLARMPDGEYLNTVAGLGVVRHSSTAGVQGPAMIVATHGQVSLDGLPLCAGRGAFVPSDAIVAVDATLGIAYSVRRNTPSD